MSTEVLFDPGTVVGRLVRERDEAIADSERFENALRAIIKGIEDGNLFYPASIKEFCYSILRRDDARSF